LVVLFLLAIVFGCPFSFGHCIVFPSSIYSFSLPLWYLFFIDDWFVYGVWCHFQQYLSYIMAVSFIGGGNWSTQRKPPT
jgi:hypothetical protein